MLYLYTFEFWPYFGWVGTRCIFRSGDTCKRMLFLCQGMTR